ncbi:EAL domain-containing protein [Dactylosporangium sp. NPDC049742]|uniref:putative bifunctional diguanylate cyclase/phosphodiesterase n=1 Tax=Dactylosporangium sp. NPDC049742 TaxID=3154737 RepID=UPI0034373566
MTGSGQPSPVARLRDAVFGASRADVALQAGIVLIAWVWFAVNVQGPVGSPVLGWVPNLCSAALAGAALWTVGTGPRVNPAAARFWRFMGAGTLLVGVGSVVRGIQALHEPKTSIGPVDGAIYLVAVLLEGWALLRLPLGLERGRRRVTFLLDACTVVVAGGLFLWQFWLRPSLERDSGNQAAFVTGLVTLVVSMLALFAIVKVALTGTSTVDKAALQWFGLAIVVGALASAPEALLPPGAPSPSQLAVPLSCLFAVFAARLERRGRTAPDPAVTGGRRRPFSVMPYVAVAACNVLLLFVMSSDDPGERLGVAVGVVILAVLVIARQMLTFQDNTRLVARLDAGMVELGDRERRFRSLVQNASDLITVTDADGVLTYVSPGATRLLGLPAEQWPGRPAADMLYVDDVDLVLTAYQRVIDDPGTPAVFQARLAHADGSWRWAEITMANLLHDPGVAGIVCNSRDITDARDFQQRLRHQASHDALTDLANRSLFGERISEALAAGPPERLRVLLIDLNEFKTVNDTLGHAVGDALLIAAANRLRAAVRRADTVARLGGDEFAVLLEHADDEAALAVIARIAAAFDEPVHVDGHRLRLAASIGVALGTVAATPQELLRRADVAMYAAKADRDGPRIRHVDYAAPLDVQVQARATLERDLRTGIDEERFSVVYQPIVALGAAAASDADPGTDPGAAPAVVPAMVEALVRWEHPDLGTVSPADFIPVAEASGLIVPLGRWILAQTCRQAVRWHQLYGDAAPRMSVNVSARQLQEADFATDVARLLTASGLAPHRLTVEITETATLHPSCVQSVHALRALGVRISLDDFGTGHSSLSTLQTCPVDEIKLDRAFTGTCTAPDGRTVAAAVIQMARALRLDAVAEGIETPAQAQRLRELGYPHGQGYHFAKPQPAEAIDTLLAAATSAVAAH